MKYNLNRKVGCESRRTYQDKIQSGFFDKYMSGNGLDIGGRGYDDSVSILESAILVDLGYPGYDGKTLPFLDNSQDYVYNSHCLEHISNPYEAIKEWYRVTKVGGYIIIIAPHKFLYEKKANLPSRWNGSHYRFYTPASLLKEVEESLTPNTYRVRLLEDGDKDFMYDIGPENHSSGQYEITLVLEKIKEPEWKIV